MERGRGPRACDELDRVRPALLNKQFKSVKDRKGNRWRKGIKLREQGIFGDFTPDESDRANMPQPAVDERNPPPWMMRSSAGHDRGHNMWATAGDGRFRQPAVMAIKGATARLAVGAVAPSRRMTAG
jgi:hypothetical protein